MAASGHISEMRPLTTRSINTCLDENDQIDDSKFIGRRGHGSVISTSRFWQIRLPHPSWPPPTFPNLNNFVSVAACDTTSSTTISVSTWSPFPYLHFFMIVLLPLFPVDPAVPCLDFSQAGLATFWRKELWCVPPIPATAYTSPAPARSEAVSTKQFGRGMGAQER